MLLYNFFEDYLKSNDPNVEFFDYKKNAVITHKQKFINTVKKEIKLFKIYKDYITNNTYLYLFFMFYQCINLKFNHIWYNGECSQIILSYNHSCINIIIHYIDSNNFKYIIYCDMSSNAIQQQYIITTSDVYNIYSNEIIEIKSEFTKHVTWYKRLLPLYMSSDYASPNLLNRIPEDVSRYIISQYL